MEVQRHTVDERSRTVDITRQNREAIASNNPPLSPPAKMPEEAPEAAERDRIDVSPAGREIAEPSDERSRSERLHQLSALRERGELNTGERVERAAVRLLERL